MISQAVWLLLLTTASSRAPAARTDIMERDTKSLSISSADWSCTTSQHIAASSVELPVQGMHAGRHLLSVYQQRQADGGRIMEQPDKKMKRKLSLDNNTGLKKIKQRRNGATNAGASEDEASRNSKKPVGILELFPQHRSQIEDSRPADPFHEKGTSDLQDALDSPGATNEFSSMDHDSNRPSKIHPYKPEIFPNHNKLASATNRHPSSLLYQFNPFRKGPESKERLCLSECHRERDERESYCNSDFAVNGIVHNVETLSRGTQLLTLLVNSAGLYKMNRLYITPDGFFFRVKVLAVDPLRCRKPCLDFKLGSRYIVMGQIYHKRMELPSSIQEMVSGRLRPGDGLVRSSSYVRRFNRKKERKVLAIAHNKCK